VLRGGGGGDVWVERIGEGKRPLSNGGQSARGVKYGALAGLKTSRVLIRDSRGKRRARGRKEEGIFRRKEEGGR